LRHAQLTASARIWTLGCPQRAVWPFPPKDVRFGLSIPSSFRTHQEFGSIRILQGLQTAHRCRIPIPYANETLCRADFWTSQRLITLEHISMLSFCSMGSSFLRSFFPLLRSRAHIAHRESKRSSVRSKRHRVMDKQAFAASFLLLVGPSPSMPLWLYSHTGRILYGQNNI